ncbi:MAG: polysaccharide biosynthesis C-terminal domain-containing protein, partial [Candidatus Gracilibacteria bacterium]|nr:polysaccharide biosynthesis C-terminal domain-containing protein [Candidatus Gracilibacteria bacterium]
IYSSSDVFFIVLLVLIFYFISNLFIYILIASNNESKLLKINIIVAIFNIIFNIIFIPYFSFIGSGITTVLSQILLFMIGYVEVNKITKINIPIKFTIVNILISAIIYIFGNYILTNYSKGLFLDIIIYGSIISLIYLIYFVGIYKLSFNKKINEL